jgi:hypothetical protein
MDALPGAYDPSSMAPQVPEESKRDLHYNALVLAEEWNIYGCKT